MLALREEQIKGRRQGLHVDFSVDGGQGNQEGNIEGEWMSGKSDEFHSGCINLRMCSAAKKTKEIQGSLVSFFSISLNPAAAAAGGTSRVQLYATA